MSKAALEAIGHIWIAIKPRTYEQLAEHLFEHNPDLRRESLHQALLNGLLDSYMYSNEFTLESQPALYIIQHYLEIFEKNESTPKSCSL